MVEHSLSRPKTKRIGFTFGILPVLSLSCFSLLIFLPAMAAGFEVFSTKDQPFGVSYDDWIAKYWNWEFSLTQNTANPQQNGCLIHKVNSMVMVYNPADGGSVQQNCLISNKEGIMIPLWSAYCDNRNPGHENDTYEQLTKCAREEYDQGKVTAVVIVDGTKVAELNEELSAATGPLVYKVYSSVNVNELYSKGFILTVPENSSRLSYFDGHAGNYRSGGHGWYVFLKPLPVGDHTILYRLHVDPPYDTSAEVVYTFHVRQ